MTLFSEITEQPERIKSRLALQKRNMERIADAIRQRNIEYVFLATPGTSGNAGGYTNYLLGAVNGLPLALTQPTLFRYYKMPPKLKNALAIGVSQAGSNRVIL